MTQDLRFGVRMLLKNPGFTAVALLTLALGIGANTALFSIIDAALLHPLPVPEPERLVMVWTENPRRGWHNFPASEPDYRDWQQSGVFERLGGFTDGGFNVRIGDRSERVPGVFATAEVLEALRARPRLGRIFQAEDMKPGHGNVVILTDALWHSMFSGDPGIVGRVITVDGAPRTVIGVLPRNFVKLSQEQMYAPLVFSADDLLRGKRFFGVMGRLRRDIGLAAAQARLADVARRLEKQYPREDAGVSVRLQPLEQAAVEDAEPLLLILSGVVGFVLLIACANIAGLLLARGTARQREMAIRTALGASRRALVRQTLTESMVLALLGGGLGLLPALWGISLITSLGWQSLPDASLITLNFQTLVFSLLLSLGAGVLFGLAPALQMSRTDINEALKATAARIQGSRQRLRGVLVAGEVAVTFVLLAGAGLMLASFAKIRTANPGYDSRQVLSLRVALPGTQYETPERQYAFFDAALRRMRELPGVRDAGMADALPTSDDFHGSGMRFEGRPEPGPGDIPVVLHDSVSPDYFRTMRMPLLRGRYFGEADRKDSELVLIVDQPAAQRHWPGHDPLGQRVKLDQKGPWRKVVGVVGAVRRPVLAVAGIANLGQVYLPLAQEPKPAMTFVLRAQGDAAALAGTARKTITAVDPTQPVFEVQTLDAARAAHTVPQRLGSILLGAFGGLALLLTMIGIYGIVAFNVGLRTREIGIRMALGAGRRDVLGTVIRQGLVLMLAGVAAGVAGALALTRLMSGLLYEVRPTDPPTFAGVALLLAAAVVLASYFPARRAATMDPVTALRQD